MMHLTTCALDRRFLLPPCTAARVEPQLLPLKRACSCGCCCRLRSLMRVCLSRQLFPSLMPSLVRSSVSARVAIDGRHARLSTAVQPGTRQEQQQKQISDSGIKDLSKAGRQAVMLASAADETGREREREEQTLAISRSDSSLVSLSPSLPSSRTLVRLMVAGELSDSRLT